MRDCEIVGNLDEVYRVKELQNDRHDPSTVH